MTTGHDSRFLELSALGPLERLRFVPGRRVEGSYSGRHHSRRAGGAGEFMDFREYSPGEDLRRIDWRVLARTGRAYVRLFQDETDLACTIAIDESASMRFGGPTPFSAKGSKLEYVQYLTSALCHLIGRQQDQVGLAVLGKGLRYFIAPSAAPTHIANILSSIARLGLGEPEFMGSTQLAPGIADSYRRSPRRGILVLASDFLEDDLEGVFAGLRLFRERGDEVVLLHVVHPEEENLPDGPAFRFEDLEGAGSIACATDDVREAYRIRFEEHAATVRRLATSVGCEYRRLSTATHYVRALADMLTDRGRMR